MEFIKALLGNFVFFALLLGGMAVLFTGMRFDWALYVFLLAITAFVIFVYWPRKPR
ncbi:hypothetical protein J2T09_003075 [Neorhizobium huautlense]|uniref:Uncharacterized protein n=1 Tax=Neorhizobium huautlense TaxID=67774 RepID=A0ABT9PW25_9HYPH|nr:hypothetical protein [Neorhizobium huautlense]MDP9838308.1 hypothetical protein [Neorhizobium huautlense]